MTIQFVSPSSRHAGFSLVELMVSMLLGLILIAGVLQIMVDSARTGEQIRRSGEVADTGRYLTSLLKEEISLAGYYGELDNYHTGATLQPNPCVVSQANLVSGMTFPLDGRDAIGVNQTSFSCIAPKNGTDVLVIRRASTTFVETTAGLGNGFYLQTTPTNYVLDLGNSGNFLLTQKDGVTPARIRQFHQTFYYVGWNDVFYRYRITTPGASIEPIAAGVVDFQVEYGIDRSGNGSPNAEAGNAAWVAAPTAAEWDDVVAIRFHLLVRSAARTTQPDTKTYTYAGVQRTPNTNYNHGVFSSAAQITNVAIRRYVQ